MASPHDTAKAPKRVLVVDDYPDAIEVWKLLLEASGYGVATATDGASALRVAAQHRPDAVVVDLQLPDVPGLELARMLREQTAPAARLIALTGRAITPELEQQLVQVFDDVLVKPCEPSDLLARIEGTIPSRNATAPTGVE